MLHLDSQNARIGRLGKAPHNMSTQAEKVLVRLASDLNEGRLPCINMPYVDELKTALTALEPYLHGFKHMLVLGIGGSALGARALQQAFYPEQDYPNHQGRSLWIADNINTTALDAWLGLLNPHETLVVVISKSGGTIESMAQYFLLRQWLQSTLGAEWTKHVLAITDATQGYLRQEVNEQAFRALPVPNNLGGRYSIFSAVGMVPAAFLGIPWQELLDGALAMNASLVHKPGIQTLTTHPSWHIATWAYDLIMHDYDELIFFNYMPCWASFGAWFTQLWAESLGKAGKGSMPVPAIGVTDQHSLLQMFLDGPKNKACLLLCCPNLPQGSILHNVPDDWGYLRNRAMGELLQAEYLGTAVALTQNQIPLMQTVLEGTSPRHAGALMALCMTATIFTGWLLDINPLDQPAVELGKRLAKARLLSTSDACQDVSLASYKAELDSIQHFLKPETS